MTSNFFFHDTATTEIYTLSLHDALPILEHDLVGVAHGDLSGRRRDPDPVVHVVGVDVRGSDPADRQIDRKSTRLNSSHVKISYAVFCLKKKMKALDSSGVLSVDSDLPPS